MGCRGFCGICSRADNLGIRAGTQEIKSAEASARWRTIGLGLMVLGMVEDVLGKGWVDEEFRKMREINREADKEWRLDS